MTVASHRFQPVVVDIVIILLDDCEDSFARFRHRAVDHAGSNNSKNDECSDNAGHIVEIVDRFKRYDVNHLLLFCSLSVRNERVRPSAVRSVLHTA